MLTALIKVLEIVSTQEKKNKNIWMRLNKHLLGYICRGYLKSMDTLVLNWPKIIFCYFTFYLSLTLNEITCFHLKRGLSFSESFSSGLKELMQFPRMSNLLPGSSAVHVRVWLQDICSHPKTNLAQLKMSARERIQGVVRPRNQCFIS